MLEHDLDPQYYVDRLYMFGLFSDDLPNERVGVWHPDYPMMKCKGNTICGLMATLCNLQDSGLLTDRRDNKVIQYFIDYPWDFDRFTTVEEIEMINVTLGLVGNYLINRYQLNLDKTKLNQEFVSLKRTLRANWGVE
ncbi:MAG TPA: hypothetical protein VG895_02430 [Patescibacteria group bacterium]|nr:hypothetical protein [Patescibacteria group bacterium]